MAIVITDARLRSQRAGMALRDCFEWHSVLPPSPASCRALGPCGHGGFHR